MLCVGFLGFLAAQLSGGVRRRQASEVYQIVFAWLQRRREILRLRAESWQDASTPGAGGLSEFQRGAESALGEAGYTLRERATISRLGAGADLTLVGFLGTSNLAVRLHVHAMELRAPNDEILLFEEADKGTPQELIAQLVKRVRELLDRAV